MWTYELCGDTISCEEEDGKTQSHANTKSHSNKNNKQQERKRKNAQRQKQGNPTGRVEGVYRNVTTFIENDLRGRIVTTHPDGQ
jgi:hypothetical protein